MVLLLRDVQHDGMYVGEELSDSCHLEDLFGEEFCLVSAGGSRSRQILHKYYVGVAGQQGGLLA